MKNKTPLAIVILAAGRGTRMKSSRAKVMHEIAGRPMISWLIETAEQLNPEKIIVVTASDMDDVADAVAPYACVVQDKQLGTGDAVKPAMALLGGFKGKVLVLLGDEPFLNVQDLEEMIATDDISVMAVRSSEFQGLGRMVLNDDQTLDRIVEEKDCTSAQKEIDLRNAGNFCFPAEKLANWLGKLQNDNKQSEYYLTDIPKIAQGEGVSTKVIETAAECYWGINTRAQLAEHEAVAQNRLRAKAMENGATLIDPATVTFCWDTKIGEDVLVEPNVIFAAGVTIDNNVQIFGFSYIEGAHIEAGAKIGPFARIRPQSHIMKKAKVGTFVEINRSTIKAGAKVPHLTYVGDVTIGERANIGAGTVFANYDGVFKHKSTIGKDVFVGSNSTVISPVTVGEGAILAAGSNINKDVPENAMAIGRSRQENRHGWASEYRKIKQEEKKKV